MQKINIEVEMVQNIKRYDATVNNTIVLHKANCLDYMVSLIL